MLTADGVRKALELEPFEGFARKALNSPPSDITLEFGPRRTGRTTRMLCSLLAAASSGRTVSIYAIPLAYENALKEKAREWAERLKINPKLIVGSLGKAEIEFFDHSYYGL